MVVVLLLVLFEPGLEYKVEAPAEPIDSRDFLCLVGALSDGLRACFTFAAFLRYLR